MTKPKKLAAQRPQSLPANAEAVDLDKLRQSYLSALGPALKPEELAAALKHVPSVTATQRALSAEDRLELIEDLQEHVVVPHPTAIDVYHSVRAALRRRYGATTIGDLRQLRQLHGVEIVALPGTVRTDLLRPSASIGLLGPTGIGKTTLLEGMAALFPDSVRHKAAIPGTEVVQIPVVYIALTGDATVKNLLIRVVECIDRRLGTDINIRKVLTGRFSADSLKLHVQQMCVRYGVGIIFVDETQSMTSSRAGGSELVINELLYLRDALGIPLVFAGTYRMMSLIASDARMTRRLSQNGLYSMAYATDVRDPYWQQLCEARWKCLVVRKPAPLTDKIKSTLFNCTQGMTWALPALLCKAQKEAILSESETVDADVLMETFSERATEMHDLVRAMASRDPGLLTKYEDLYHPAFDALQAQKRNQEFQRLNLIGNSTSETSESQPKRGAGTRSSGQRRRSTSKAPVKKRA